jgi:hypothetical protein
MGRWFVVVCVLLAAPRSEAADPPRESLPFFGHIASPQENSALSMDCDGDPLGTIDCSFTQVSVTAEEPAKRTERLAKLRDEIAKARTVTAAERAEMRSDMCKREANPPAGLPERVAVWRKMVDAFAPACACKNDNCFDSEVLKAFIVLAEGRKCRVWTHNFNASMTRVRGERKWVGMSEPTGLCRTVNATVIESDDKGILWKFTQTRLTADTASEPCKDLAVNKPIVYSWDTEADALLDCDVIGFGH